VAVLLRASLAHTGGRLVYALDDAYIHMAVARALALHGVWGVTPYAFTSSTSSLAWPLLLALGDLLTGVHDSAPLVLNLALAAVAVLAADRRLRGASIRIRAVALVAMVVLAPMPTLVLSGMEHGLHIVAVLWFLGCLRRADEDEAPSVAALVALAASSALATTARYESLFLLAPAVVVLALHRRGRAALVALLAGVLPLAVYAAISIAHGWPPVPNSLLLKRATFAGAGLSGLANRLGGHALRTLVEAPHLLVLVLAVLLLAAFLPASRGLRSWDVVFVAATFLHAQLAAVGWLFRYEAYLVVIGIVLLAAHLAEWPAVPPWPRSRCVAVALATAVAAAPLVVRAMAAFAQTPAAVRNIYEQQYQMGLVLGGLPAGATVMANDIGAVAYLADVRLVDLYGLATLETARARRAGTLDRDLLRRLAEADPPAAVVLYKSWFADAIPPEWIEVGSWRVPEKVVVADRTVSFFATRPQEAAALSRALAAFAPRLPPDVSSRLADLGPP
jgi:hypothetical protein